ncbi:MAG: four helix bundle protein [Bacteroidota bacterium]|nr:four helix bundle protein [Bacteroidota bacterium]
MSVTPETLKKRTFEFALNTLRTIEDLKRTTANEIMGKQVMRSATSVGANCKTARKAKSSADFISKLKIVEEESGESVYWLELIKAYNKIENKNFDVLLSESKELERTFAASAITGKNNNKR